MKSMLMRPSAALFPAVLLLSGLAGKGETTGALFLCYCMVQLFSLCSVDAFRNAAAREPGVKRVDRRFSGTWPMILLGIAASAAVCMLTGFCGLPLVIAGGCIIIEQMFEERMYALSRNVDGVVLSIISNALLLVGLLLDASGSMVTPVENMFTLCGAGLGMVISIIAAYVIEPMHAFSLVPRNIAFFPKAAVQNLLYPVVIFVILAIFTNAECEPFTAVFQSDFSYVFAGLILWRLSRTVCRRANDESRPLNLVLVAACALLMIGGCFVEILYVFGFFAIIALLCAIIVYCAPSVRLYVGFMLLCVAWLFYSPYNQSHLIGIACSAIAIILNLHKAFLKKV